MEENRLKLQTLLEDVLGNKNVYFQPPESLKIQYPCIVYERNPIKNVVSDNSVYNQKLSYTITLIDKNPCSDVVMKLSQLPLCRHDRCFKSDNLNHDVFSIYI